VLKVCQAVLRRCRHCVASAIGGLDQMQGLPVLCSAGECQDVDLAKHVPASSMLMTCTAAECAWPLQKHADNEGDQHPHKDTDLESGDMDDSSQPCSCHPSAASGVRTLNQAMCSCAFSVALHA
jgi:hypothetical protein